MRECAKKKNECLIKIGWCSPRVRHVQCSYKTIHTISHRNVVREKRYFFLFISFSDEIDEHEIKNIVCTVCVCVVRCNAQTNSWWILYVRILQTIIEIYKQRIRFLECVRIIANLSQQKPQMKC